MRKTTQRYVSLRQRAGRAICSFATAAALAALGCSIAATNAVAQERHELSYTGDLIDILPQLRQIDPSMTITRSGTLRTLARGELNTASTQAGTGPSTSGGGIAHSLAHARHACKVGDQQQAEVCKAHS